MKKFGIATIASGGLVAAVLGLAAPAEAIPVADAPAVLVSAPADPNGTDHQVWLDQLGPHVNVPQVDTSVHNRTVTKHTNGRHQDGYPKRVPLVSLMALMLWPPPAGGHRRRR